MTRRHLLNRTGFYFAFVSLGIAGCAGKKGTGGDALDPNNPNGNPNNGGNGIPNIPNTGLANEATRGKVVFVIQWPERTRSIPENAQSIRIRNLSADDGLPPVDVLVVRPDSDATNVVYVPLEPREYIIMAYLDKEGRTVPQSYGYGSGSRARTYNSFGNYQTYDVQNDVGYIFVDATLRSAVSVVNISPSSPAFSKPNESITLTAAAYGIFSADSDTIQPSYWDYNYYTPDKERLLLVPDKGWTWSIDNTKDYSLVVQGSIARITQINSAPPVKISLVYNNQRESWYSIAKSLYLGSANNNNIIIETISTPQMGLSDSSSAGGSIYINISPNGDSVYGFLGNNMYAWNSSTDWQTMRVGNMTNISASGNCLPNAVSRNGDFVFTSNTNSKMFIKKASVAIPVEVNLLSSDGSSPQNSFVNNLYITKYGKYVLGTYRIKKEVASSGTPPGYYYYAFIWNKETGFSDVKTLGQNEYRKLTLQENYEENGYPENGIIWGVTDYVKHAPGDDEITREYIAFDLTNNRVTTTLNAPGVEFHNNLSPKVGTRLDNFKAQLEKLNLGVNLNDWNIYRVIFSEDRKTAIVFFSQAGQYQTSESQVVRLRYDKGF
jgi:hypothetical protein